MSRPELGPEGRAAMYCDRYGKPDPNGDYQLIEGKLCVRDGRRVSFDVMFMDALGKRTILTDSERAAAVAKAVRDHALRNGYTNTPLPFTAADEARAINAAERDKAAHTRFLDRVAAETASAKRVRDAAHAAHKEQLSTAWQSKRY
jgi:hypothetical protein